MNIRIEQMSLEELKAYRASVEAYGTARESYEVEIRIKEPVRNVDSK